MAKILDGKKAAQDLKEELKLLRKKYDNPITLACICVGSSPASQSYINSQQKWADDLNIEYKLINLEANVSFEDTLKKIDELNSDDSINGIFINRPLPSDWDESAVFEAILPSKDVEGMHPFNLGKLLESKPKVIAPTVLSVLKLLDSTNIDLFGKNVTIVGFSAILGKPLSIILADRFATVSIAHIGTSKAAKLEKFVSSADIVVSAVGKKDLIKGSWIKDQAVVIDVGIKRVNDKIYGDVEFEPAAKRASFITPVPGGVGALTVGFLYKNLICSCL